MMKTIIIVCVALVILLSGIYFLDQQGNNTPTGSSNFIDCLQKKGVVIYGTPTCPYCVQLVAEYDAYDDFEKIYVDCNTDYERCNNEMLTDGVPEIQIEGKFFKGWGSPENLAKETGCVL